MTRSPNRTDRLDAIFASPSELRAALVREHGGADAYYAYLPFGFGPSGSPKHGVRYDVSRSTEYRSGRLVKSEWTVGAGLVVETWGDVVDAIFG